MVYLAPQLQEVLGLPEYGPITAWADVIHPDDRPQHTRMVAALYRGEIPRLDIEFRYRAQDGTWKWARQHGVVVRGPDGRARRMVGVTGEITETRQRERQFDAAKAEAFAAHRDVEQAREIMQTRARQHERRRHAVGQGFPLAVQQSRATWRAGATRPACSIPASPAAR